MCCFLGSSFKIQPFGYLTKNIYLYPIRKNPYDKIIREELKEQHLSLAPFFLKIISLALLNIGHNNKNHVICSKE